MLQCSSVISLTRPYHIAQKLPNQLRGGQHVTFERNINITKHSHEFSIFRYFNRYFDISAVSAVCDRDLRTSQKPPKPDGSSCVEAGKTRKRTWQDQRSACLRSSSFDVSARAPGCHRGEKRGNGPREMTSCRKPGEERDERVCLNDSPLGSREKTLLGHELVVSINAARSWTSGEAHLYGTSPIGTGRNCSGSGAYLSPLPLVFSFISRALARA